MAIKQLRLPLFNDPFYSYSTTLEGNRYFIDFLFIERINQWVTTLKDSSGEVLVRNQRLTPKAPLFFDYRLPNLTGFFYFEPISPDQTDNNIRNPKEFYKLFYIFDDGE